MTTVKIATCAAFPDLHEDDRPLVVALRARGATVVPAVWDDPAADWSGTTLIRSTWDYFHRRDAFVAWARRVPKLVNSAAIVAWNSHKGYLLDLAARGARVIPTELVPRGADAGIVRALVARWPRLVVKPAISAGAYRTIVTTDPVEAERHLADLVRDVDALVQPYFASVERRGERGIVCIGGAPTHVVRKPAFASGAVLAAQGPPLPEPVTPDDAALARAVLALAPETPSYARVDVVPDEHGVMHLMELELIEPRLFFAGAAHAAERLADTVLSV